MARCLLLGVWFAHGSMIKRPKALAWLAVAGAAATLACPIQRAPVPPEYLGFRGRLQDAVTDTALVEMEGLPRMQNRLEVRLTDLAAIVTVDSLLTALDADRELAPLSGAIATTVRLQLEAKGVGGGVRKAFRNPDGQRQAVDAIIIGLGRALYRVRSASGESPDSSAGGGGMADRWTRPQSAPTRKHNMCMPT